MDLKNFGIALEAETTDCTIEIYLNDIPVGLCGIGGSRKLSRPVHEYLLDGENEIGVLVNPGDTPAKAMQFSRFELPAYGAQPPLDPALEAFLEFRRDEERKERQAQARQNGEQTDGESNSAGDETPERDEKAKSANGEKEPPEDDTGESFKAEESTLSFSVKLTLYPVGVIAGAADGETLLGIDWNARESAEVLRTENYELPLAREGDVGPQLFPVWLAKKGDLGDMFGPYQWLEAKRLTLDEDTAEEVTQFIFFIRDLIEEGDADSILDISTEKYHEVASSYGISSEERAELFRQVLSQQSGKPEWIFETPEDKEISLRLCANERLIECVGHDWKPVIRAVPSPEGRFLFPMLIGKLGEDWLIMR